MSSQLMRAQDLNFNENGVKEVYRRVIVLLNNVNSFYNLFSEENSEIDKFSEKHILDKWIVSKTNKLVRDVTNALEDYNTITACTEILNFVEDLSTWYVRRSRDRFKSSDSKIKKQAVKTLAWVLNNLSRLLAPITPFISEEIYQSFKEKNNKLNESVHLETWPTYDQEKIDEVILEEMKATRELVSKALEQREKSKIPIRQALNKLTIKGIELKKEYLELIQDELNVKNIELKKSKNILVELDTTITPELLLEGISRDIIRKVNGYRKELKLTIQNRISLYFETDDKQVSEGLEKHLGEIKESVQADNIEKKIPKNYESKEVKINNVPVKIGIKVL
tara:strand:- start:93 stop:1103 length:1011 start_codon:yes stop_codon:yes gene_type:complete